jgi:hypothetical protein
VRHNGFMRERYIGASELKSLSLPANCETIQQTRSRLYQHHKRNGTLAVFLPDVPLRLMDAATLAIRESTPYLPRCARPTVRRSKD